LACASAKRRAVFLSVCLVAAGLEAGPSAAADEDSRPLKPEEPCPAKESLASVWPIEGFPKDLDKGGLQICLNYIGEGLGNVRGGIRRGATYDGRLEGVVHADLQTALGWSGATFHANAFQIHGRGLSRDFVGNLMTVSSIEALPSTRLSELWLEQEFGTIASVRFGQLAADTEFITSKYSGLFINSTFGFPAITEADLPSGGPAYPFAATGVRLKLKPSDQLTVLAALFDGNPGGPGPGDPQRRNRHGTNFRLADPPLLITEAQLAYNPDTGAKSLPGLLKLGGWHHFGTFPSLAVAFNGMGTSLAGTGIAPRLRGNTGVYAVLDQALWRDPNGTVEGGTYEGAEYGLFARAAVAPSDRNLIDFYVDLGLTFKGLVPLPGRENDTLGIGFGYASISSAVRASDFAASLASGVPGPIRDYEAVLELTYQAQIQNGWTIQPDFQYIFHPGGNVPNPRSASGAPIKDAAVFALRATLRY
jgi:porin